MQYGIIPEAFIFAYVDGLKELEDFFLVKEADEWFLKALFRDTEDCIGQLTLLRVHKTDHFGKGFEGCKPLITSFGEVLSLTFELMEEAED